MKPKVSIALARGVNFLVLGANFLVLADSFVRAGGDARLAGRLGYPSPHFRTAFLDHPSARPRRSGFVRRSDEAAEPGRPAASGQDLIDCTLARSSSVVISSVSVAEHSVGPRCRLGCDGSALPGFLISMWIMFRKFQANPFCRNYAVVTKGPYGYVRQPLFAATLLLLASAGLMLGSWFGLAAMILPAGVLILCTALEDRELHRRLDGYADYAERVRYLLVPWLW